MRGSIPRTLLSQLLILSLLLSLQGAAVPPLRAQGGAVASYEGETITSVEFIGNRTLAPETLRYYLGIEEGQTFSRTRLDSNIKRLWERELIDDISVEALSAEAGGVRLVVRVEERPTIRTVEYEGLKRVSRTDLEDRLASERIQIREGGPLNLGELYRIQSIIEGVYAEKGYRFAQANFEMEPVGENERRVVFTIDEGDRVRIGDIRFEGNTVFRDLRLRWEMKNTKESGLITRMFKKDIYNPANLSEDLDLVRDTYREAGYKNVVVGEPQIQVRAENPNAPPDERKRRLVITVPIEEGNRWKFGEVAIEGNEIFPEEPLLSVFKYRPGDWLSSETVQEGVEAIKETYNNTGYINAQVSSELVERTEEVADVVIHVNEGDQFRVGRIEFEGNTRTKDKVLRREFRVQEGRVLSLGALKNSLYKLRQLGYFELDEEDPVQFEFRDEQTVDLTVQGREADRTELQFGAGYSEGLGFFGQLSLRTQNFLGRGEQVGVSVQSGSLTEYYELSYFVPWFLDKPQSIGIQAFDRRYDFDVFDRTDFRQESSSTGGAISYGRSLGLFQNLSLQYSYSDQSYIQSRPVTNEDGTQGSQRFESLFEISSIKPTYSYNSVDNRFEPRRGTRFQAAFEYAGGALGGSEYFYRPTLTLTHYRPLTGYPLETVFGINLEGGYMDSFGGRDLNRFSLFRLGGDTSVRGFERFRLYARDPETDDFITDQNGFPIGGDRFVQANLEYHVLVSGPFRVIAYVDAGQVYAPGQDFDLGRVRYTAGAELRITLPVLGGAPLRFIWANNLNEKPNDDFNSFSFSIGSTFSAGPGPPFGRPRPSQYPARPKENHSAMSFPNPAFESALRRGGRFARTSAVLVVVCFMLGTTAPVAAQATGDVKVAVIDVERILLESERGKAALDEIESLRAEKQEQGEAMQQEINDLRQRLAEGRLSLSEERITDLEKELEDKVIAMRRFQDDANRELSKKRDQVLQTIENSVFPIINKIGEEGGYTLIFNKFSSGLVYADEAIDITAQVIERYNQSSQGQTGSEPE